jgi:hypothetical protein
MLDTFSAILIGELSDLTQLHDAELPIGSHVETRRVRLKA